MILRDPYAYGFDASMPSSVLTQSATPEAPLVPPDESVPPARKRKEVTK